MTDRGEAVSDLIDISVAVGDGTPEWPGDTPFACGWTARIGRGSSVNLSFISGSPHLGTHADAAFHVQDGWPATDALPLDAFFGGADVIDVSTVGLEIDESLLERMVPVDCQRLLLRTGRTVADRHFPDAWPVLSNAAARDLVARGLRLVGVDAPSVDTRDSKQLPIHRALLGSDVQVLENLDLRGVRIGRYQLIALPQRLAGLDAAPVRAALRPVPPS
ncbi:MAG: cyclase family protein [Gemmatimonadaceae bacterium]